MDEGIPLSRDEGPCKEPYDDNCLWEEEGISVMDEEGEELKVGNIPDVL
jgi:hypothetical protein